MSKPCSSKALLLLAVGGFIPSSISIAGELFIERVYDESTMIDLGNRVCNHWLTGSWSNSSFGISCIIGDCGEIMCDAPLDDISMVLQGSRGGVYNGLSGDLDEMTSRMTGVDSLYRIEMLDENSFHLTLIGTKNSPDEQIFSATFTK